MQKNNGGIHLEKSKKSNITLTLAAIFIATFMSSVETTIITTALPTIVSELHGITQESWVFAMYLLTTAVTTPIYGKLADQLGRKPIFIFGLVTFLIGSIACGFSPNIIVLIVSRAIQGIGAGAIMPIIFTIIADVFSFERRSNIMAMK